MKVLRLIDRSLPNIRNILVLSAVGVLVSGCAIILGCGQLPRKQQQSPADEGELL